MGGYPAVHSPKAIYCRCTKILKNPIKLPGKSLTKLIESGNCYTVEIKQNLNGTIMDMKRRDFFSNVGRKTAAVAAGVATPALVI